MTTQDAPLELTEQQIADKKRLNLLKILWPASELGGGFNKAYFSVYVAYLYTNVYGLSVMLSGTLSLVQTIIGWVGGPIFGTFLDRFSFKKAKFWPWLLVGTIIIYVSWMLMFSIPALGVSAKNLAPVAFALAIIIAVSGPIAMMPVSAVYPRLSKDPNDRAFFAMWQKVGRDGGKTVFGYVAPAMLVYFTAKAGGVESTGYAITGVIIGVITIAFYAALAFGLKGSYVEREAVAMSRAADGTKKKNIPLSQVIKTIFTNKALLSMYTFMSIHKTYYFLYVTTAAYVFKYVFGDFSKMATYMLVFNLSAVLGVLFGPLWKKIFKETKRSFVACGVAHIAFLIIIALTFKSLSANGYTMLIFGSSFFAGLLETFILPLFAASADYGAWKTGSRMDGLTMSIYSLTITTGVLLATIVRTAILQSINYDAVVKGAALTQKVVSGLSSMHSWLPLLGGIVCIAIIFIFFPLTDKKLAIINQDLKDGKTAATSEHKI